MGKGGSRVGEARLLSIDPSPSLSGQDRSGQCRELAVDQLFASQRSDPMVGDVPSAVVKKGAFHHKELHDMTRDLLELLSCSREGGEPPRVCSPPAGGHLSAGTCCRCQVSWGVKVENQPQPLECI